MMRRLVCRGDRLIGSFRVATLAGTCIGLLAAPPALAAGEHDWRTYGNARFEFTMCFPGDLMTAEPESDNGDGRTFSTKDGAQLLVWGTDNTRDLTPAQVLGDEVRRISREGGQISYKVAKPGWFALSGAKGGNIFYQRATSNGVRFGSFRLTYPKGQAAKWTPIVAHLSQCLDGNPK
ncbi:hypothetical protein G6M04_30315 [Agrobacterium rhizogenes]|uniref:hypothetical protein n=1 Tax=Rhizobium rhizogenes TaxID=359 RepID=UPI0015745474|nr:hypothetical protein [Rhizobium rhizogenes]NTG51693.1 hypothetical protein [Rhizobium rhizogenes]